MLVERDFYTRSDIVGILDMYADKLNNILARLETELDDPGESVCRMDELKDDMRAYARLDHEWREYERARS